MRNRILLAASLAVSLLCAAFTYQAQSSKAQVEYKLEYGATEKKVNELAAQGWEVVAVGSGGTTVNVPVFVFKRQK